MSSRNSSLCRHSLRVEYNKSIANCYLLTIVNSVEVGMVVVVVVEVGVSPWQGWMAGRMNVSDLPTQTQIQDFQEILLELV